MAKALFERSTGLYAGSWSRYDDIPHDPSTHIQVEGVPEFELDAPDPRHVRWDGASGVRQATQPEIQAYDGAEEDREEGRLMDDSLLNRALVLLLASRFGVPPSAIALQWKGLYRQLKNQ